MGLVYLVLVNGVGAVGWCGKGSQCIIGPVFSPFDPPTCVCQKEVKYAANPCDL